MRTRALAVMAIAAVVLVTAVAFVSGQATRPGDTLQLWEYRTEVLRSPATKPVDRGVEPAGDVFLNSLGREGWELAGVARREIRVDDVMQTETLYAFKRPTRTINR